MAKNVDGCKWAGRDPDMLRRRHNWSIQHILITPCHGQIRNSKLAPRRSGDDVPCDQWAELKLVFQTHLKCVPARRNARLKSTTVGRTRVGAVVSRFVLRGQSVGQVATRAYGSAATPRHVAMRVARSLDHRLESGHRPDDNRDRLCSSPWRKLGPDSRGPDQIAQVICTQAPPCTAGWLVPHASNSVAPSTETSTKHAEPGPVPGTVARQHTGPQGSPRELLKHDGIAPERPATGYGRPKRLRLADMPPPADGLRRSSVWRGLLLDPDCQPPVACAQADP